MPKRRKLAKIPLIGGLLKEAMDAKFLWSFHLSEVSPAFLVGWVVTLSPLFGLHTILAILGAIMFRSNLIIPLALQLVSTPLTLPFIWPALYAVGHKVIEFSTGSRWLAIAASGSGNHHLTGKFLARTTAVISLGAIVVGVICAAISTAIYALVYGRRHDGGDVFEADEDDGSNGTQVE
jgi:uncharacterized protein (DUF2062 family)